MHLAIQVRAERHPDEEWARAVPAATAALPVRRWLRGVLGPHLRTPVLQVQLQLQQRGRPATAAAAATQAGPVVSCNAPTAPRMSSSSCIHTFLQSLLLLGNGQHKQCSDSGLAVNAVLHCRGAAAREGPTGLEHVKKATYDHNTPDFSAPDTNGASDKVSACTYCTKCAGRHSNRKRTIIFPGLSLVLERHCVMPATKPRGETMGGKMSKQLLSCAAVFTGTCLLGGGDRLFLYFCL